MRLPLTVIGGYLGAGKTTLINRLLAEPRGKRLMVLVNDFGAINIDAALLASAQEDTLTLTNGCVCCTMGADLFLAVGDVLDRRPRPDHMIIEASGIADPARIAQVAQTEPELDYAGIVTVVDAAAFPALAADPRIGDQLRGQVACADLLLISKAEAMPPALALSLAAMSRAPQLLAVDAALGDVVLSDVSVPAAAPRAHPAYVQWAHRGEERLSRTSLMTKLERRPEALYRLKGYVRDGTSGWEVQVVGQQIALRPAPVKETTLVGIGLSGRISTEDIEAWWSG